MKDVINLFELQWKHKKYYDFEDPNTKEKYIYEMEDGVLVVALTHAASTILQIWDFMVIVEHSRDTKYPISR